MITEDPTDKEFEKDYTAIKFLEKNIWNIDHELQDFFHDHNMREIEIAQYYLNTRENYRAPYSDHKGTAPQHAVVLTAEHYKMTRYEVAFILMKFIAPAKIVKSD